MIRVLELLRREQRGLLALLALYALAVAGLALVYWRPQPLQIDVGTSYARPHLFHFYANESDDHSSYAFSGQQGAITLQGLGGTNSVVSLAMNGWRPPGVEPAVLNLDSAGHDLHFKAGVEPAIYHVFAPTAAGDVRLNLDSNVYQPAAIAGSVANPGDADAADTRFLGIRVDAVTAQQLGSLPPLRIGFYLLALITLLFLLGRRVGLTPLQAAGLAVLALLALLAGLYGARLLITVALGRWVAAAALLHVLLGPLQWLLRGTLERHQLAVTPAGWNWLWAVFGLAFLFKVGGVLYPHIQIFDENAHAIRVQKVLDGHFGELYYPSFTSFMGVTVGIEGGHFPYSPLWYLVTVPLHWLGFSIDDAMNGLNAILDTSKLLLTFLIALRTLGRERLALLAAALYPLLPMPYFLLSWGNYPTQFGLWAALLATTFVVLNYEQIWQRRTFAWWAALLALSILSYTVIGIFAFTMFGALALLELARGRKMNRRVVKGALAGMLVAELFAFSIYHVHFASAFFNETLPSLFASAQENAGAPAGQQAAPQATDGEFDPRESPAKNFEANTSFLYNHTTHILLHTAILGLIWLYIDRLGRRWWPLWTAWIAIFVIYSLVSAFVADMVLKHIFFVMPLLCIAAALAADTVWQRWRPARWAVLAGMLALAVFTTERWHYYLLIKRH